MKLHFEEEDLTKRAESSALVSILKGTAEKIFEILLNRFGPGVQGHQAMMRFQK